jgi:hypothetical protein
MGEGAQRDEIAPFHPQCLPRFPTERNSTPQRRKRVLRCGISVWPMSLVGLGRVKTFSCKRSELEEVATRAIFPDFDYALIAAING